MHLIAVQLQFYLRKNHINYLSNSSVQLYTANNKGFVYNFNFLERGMYEYSKMQ